jgi:hypothetical protein
MTRRWDSQPLSVAETSGLARRTKTGSCARLCGFVLMASFARSAVGPGSIRPSTSKPATMSSRYPKVMGLRRE